MKNENAIEVKNLGKKFSLGEDMSGSLRESLMNFIKSPLGKLRKKNDKFWALNGVDFEVKKGEVIGVIGRNGAGKSTLLKILSRITDPTEGEVRLKGRISSLLEVGTGFHPELTGRENIYLNGAVLGMSKKEITRQFDDIVDFSGVAKFLDMPVKRYSTGMRVRLGFAVAAYLEPEILLVDEVLAVGDAEFQKKCLGKMDEISHESGRTILFVSHNMSAVSSLCNRCIYLEKGKLKMIGETNKVIAKYLSDSATTGTSHNMKDRTDRNGNQKVILTSIKFLDQNNHEVKKVMCGEDIVIEIGYEAKEGIDKINNFNLSLAFNNSFGQLVSFVGSQMASKQFNNLPAKGTIKCKIPKFPLNQGTFYITTFLYVNNETTDHIDNAIKLDVEQGDYFGTGINSANNVQWVIINNEWTKD